MCMYGDDYNYAHSRLQETIVRIGANPIYVYSVSPGMMVQYAELEDLDAKKVCYVKDLDLKPVPLGYCNYNKYACYLSRMPMRRDWRQGLRRGNFISSGAVHADRIPYSALKKTILGEYPKFIKALESVGKVNTIAWHRHWAVDRLGQVFHKGAKKPVGKIVNGAVELNSQSMYLKEALQESL